MQPNQILCPVDHVKTDFPFPQQNLQPVIKFLDSNTPLPETNTAFPVGTITTDGRLDMCKQQLGIRGLELVAEPLKNNQVVKHLLLGTNAFGNTGAAAVAELVAANNSIETVYLGCNYIEQEGCKAICEAIEASPSVKSVWFKRNPIGAESIPAIIKMLSGNKQLRTLDLVNTGVGEGFHTLLEYLQHNDSVERLYLSGNYLTAATMKYVSKMLAGNKHLKSLYLSVNNIGDEGVVELIPGLAANTTLEDLSLASCGITGKGMELLFTTLQANSTIKSLDLGYAASTRALGAKANELSAASAALLVEFIERQANLINLNLGKMDLPEAQRNKLIEEMSKRSGSLEMNRYQSERMYAAHEDSKAIKSVYR
jgi:Ran GTPase-activating protein (RanGAP) involved in mRNA processing and transport